MRATATARVRAEVAFEVGPPRWRLEFVHRLWSILVVVGRQDQKRTNCERDDAGDEGRLVDNDGKLKKEVQCNGQRERSRDQPPPHQLSHGRRRSRHASRRDGNDGQQAEADQCVEERQRVRQPAER
jgi:hypothetical protein